MTDVALDIFYTNVTGTPVTAATFTEDASDIDDLYTITASAVVASTTATFTVSAASGSKNPYHGRVVTLVPITATARTEVLPGVSITFSNSGSFANGWSFTLGTGIWFGHLRAGNAAGTQYKNTTGTWSTVSVSAGDPGGLVKLKIQNVTAFARSACKAALYSSPEIVTKATPKAINSWVCTSDDPVEQLDTDGRGKPYKITFYTADASPGNIGMKVQAYPYSDPAAVLNVRDIDGAVDITTANIVPDGATRYQVRSGTGSPSDELAGSIFTIAATATSTSIENLMIVDDKYVWLANDIGGGTPTVWVQSSVDLTDGANGAGVIAAGAYSLLWIKLDAPDGGNSGQNPFFVRVVIESDRTDSNDWLV